eukprot:7101887-Pyramimonas_sp.AAC.1
MEQCLRKYGTRFGFQADTLLAQAASKREEFEARIPKPDTETGPAAGAGGAAPRSPGGAGVAPGGPAAGAPPQPEYDPDDER